MSFIAFWWRDKDILSGLVELRWSSINSSAAVRVAASTSDSDGTSQ
jgi:hypothetical protein